VGDYAPGSVAGIKDRAFLLVEEAMASSTRSGYHISADVDNLQEGW